jgi:HAD superfamily hydrolase (TIGR01509 family)
VRSTVLIDLYGTLVEPDWAELLKGRTALAERLGLPAMAAHRAWDMTHASRMTGTYGSLTDDLAAVFFEATGGRRSPISATLLSQLANEERENWHRGVRLYPDVLPALRHLRSMGLQLAIVTNASAEAASVIGALALRPLVDEVFASCEAGVLKPDLLGVALRRFGLDASDATLVDDEPAQLESAARLGVSTILIQRLGFDASQTSTAGPHAVVTDLRQVTKLVLLGEPGQRR